MQLIQIDPKTLTIEKLQNLKTMNSSVNNDYNTLIYGLEEKNDLKALGVIKDYQNTISSKKELKINTKTEENNQEYAEECIKQILEELKKRPDIKELRIISQTPIITQILPKLGFVISENTEGISYIKQNPSFQIKYEMLYQMIRDNFEEQTILEYCKEDEYMKNIAKQSIIVENYRKRLNENPDLPNIDITR